MQHGRPEEGGGALDQGGLVQQQQHGQRGEQVCHLGEVQQHRAGRLLGARLTTAVQ